MYEHNSNIHTSYRKNAILLQYGEFLKIAGTRFLVTLTSAGVPDTKVEVELCIMQCIVKPVSQLLIVGKVVILLSLRFSKERRNY